MTRSSDRRTHEGGFTLIELLIVIVVLGILAGIVTIAVGSTRTDAISSACKTNFKSVELSAESVYSKTATYPTPGTYTENTQLALDTTYANLLKGANNGAVLKNYPYSTDYRLVYTVSGSDFEVRVQKGDGSAITPGSGQSAINSSGCDAL